MARWSGFRRAEERNGQAHVEQGGHVVAEPGVREVLLGSFVISVKVDQETTRLARIPVLSQVEPIGDGSTLGIRELPELRPRRFGLRLRSRRWCGRRRWCAGGARGPTRPAGMERQQPRHEQAEERGGGVRPRRGCGHFHVSWNGTVSGIWKLDRHWRALLGVEGLPTARVSRPALPPPLGKELSFCRPRQCPNSWRRVGLVSCHM